MKTVLIIITIVASIYFIGDRECIKKGMVLEADFDTLDGDIHGYYDTVGRNNGKGLCGDANFIKSGWTKDCFNHDLCQQYTRKNSIFELPGGVGPNCHDEFFRAIDDFIFGWIKCDGG